MVEDILPDLVRTRQEGLETGILSVYCLNGENKNLRSRLFDQEKPLDGFSPYLTNLKATGM